VLGEIGIGAVILGWFGSLEYRLRNMVSKERFGDLKEQTNRVEAKIDALLLKNGLDPKKHDNEGRPGS
jgi:hypothetical protein